jgi:predicted RNase H-like nuclease
VTVRAAGVDACRSGWVAVVLDDGRLAAVLARATLAEIVAACSGARVIGVDMPLGLVPRGWRQADELAAARLDGCAAGCSGYRRDRPGRPPRTGRQYCCAGP